MMIRKNLLIGFGRTLGAVVLSTGLLVGGCGDDSSSNTVDAGGIDAPLDAQVCDEPGHGGDNCDPLNPFGAPGGEGGEVRLELFQTGEDTYRLAAQAYFFKNQLPLLRPMTPELIEGINPMENGGFACFQYKDGGSYNNGAYNEHQAIADSREYIDVGNTVTMQVKGGTGEIVLAKQAEGSVEPSNRIQHKVLYVGDEAYNPERATAYSWEIDGAGEYLAFDLLNGASAATGGMPVPEGLGPDVYFPQEFTMTSPAEADYFAGPVVFTKGESLTIEWENVDEESAASPGTVSFVGFVTEDNRVESWCLSPGDRGQFVVPPEVLDYVSPNGQLLIGKFAHTAWLSAKDETRIDVLGVNCKLSSYTIEEGEEE